MYTGHDTVFSSFFLVTVLSFFYFLNEKDKEESKGCGGGLVKMCSSGKNEMLYDYSYYYGSNYIHSRVVPFYLSFSPFPLLSLIEAVCTLRGIGTIQYKSGHLKQVATTIFLLLHQE